MKPAAIVPRLLERYKKDVMPQLAKNFGYKNIFQVPRLEKIVVNMGVGKGAEDIKILEAAMGDLAAITGQKPVITRAKKAIANFKIKEGSPVGCKVTLRSTRMYEFFDRLVNIALPRIRDFQGVSADGFDGSGNYALGLREQTIFPELEYDKIQKVQGMDVIIVISNSKSTEESREFLRLMGVPFRKQGS